MRAWDATLVDHGPTSLRRWCHSYDAEAMAELAEPPVRAAPTGSPFQEGLFDRLIKAVRHSTAPAWAIYSAIAVALVVLELAVTWRDGTFPSRFGLIHLLLPVFAMFVLPALHFFDTLAARALAAARPVLTVDEAGYEDLLYRLTTRPAGATALAAASGLLALAVLTLIQPADTYEVLQIMVTPLATIVEWILQAFVWIGVGVVSFDIAGKLRLVDEIYTRHIRISVLSPGPLYAFSRLTAAMVIVTLAAVAVATIAVRELAGTTQWAAAAGAPSVLAAVAFIAPLWGAHRLMEQEKARELDAIGARVQKTVGSLRDRVDEGDLTGMSDLKDALDGLLVARKEFSSVSTWPWQRETLGGVVTAVISPLAIWLITEAIERSALI